jgi:hypothetical protein
MPYRVLKIEPTRDPIEVCAFSSAYAAVDFMTSAWFRGDVVANHLHLVDAEDSVVLSPDDMVGACALVFAPS